MYVMWSEYCWGFAYSAPTGGDVLKIINLLGNEYSGSIGKSVTASKWKGRNYLKKWFKPTNPNSGLQQETRGWMGAAVTAWHGFTPLQKAAYYWYQRYRKTNISPFNSWVGAYIAYYKSTGGVRANATDANITVEEGGGVGVVGAKIVVKKAGQATEYMFEYTIANGEGQTSLDTLDQNYDLFITHKLYEPFALLDQTAAQVLVKHDLTAL